MRNIGRWIAIAIAPVALIAGMITAGSASASPTPTAQICAAVNAVRQHATLTDENALMLAVIRNPWVKYLSSDATGYYADMRGLPASAKYAAKDIRYLTEDGC